MQQNLSKIDCIDWYSKFSISGVLILTCTINFAYFHLNINWIPVMKYTKPGFNVRRTYCVSICPYANISRYVRKFCDILFFWKIELWPSMGSQVNQKWTGSGPEVGQKWTGSVHLSVCPSQTLPLPPWRTLCEGSTSAGRLHPAIF